MWTIEAFRVDGDDLVWDVDLTGVEQSTLERHLGLDTLDTPGVVPLTAEQVRALLTETTHLDPIDYLAQAERLEFFLAEYEEG